MDVRRVGGRIAAARTALAAAGLLPLPLRIINGLAMISLVLSSCDLLRLCSDRDRPLQFPLGGREFATVLCQLASVVYLLSLFGIPFAHPEPTASDDEGGSPSCAPTPAPMHDGVESGDAEIVAAVVSGALPSHHLEGWNRVLAGTARCNLSTKSHRTHANS